MNAPLVSGRPAALPHRGIRGVIAERWGYHVAEVDGQPCEVANYLAPDGELVAQKIRFPGKRFQTRGDLRRARMYGAWLWPDRRDLLVIVEGEIDAMTVDQEVGVPVVSLRNGAGGVGFDLEAERDFVHSFERVVLLVDGDAPGRAAIAHAMDRMDPTRTADVRLPRKDANEMLIQRQVDELRALVLGTQPVGSWPLAQPRAWGPGSMQHGVGASVPAGWECVPHRDAAGHACFGPYAHDLPAGPARVEVDLRAVAPAGTVVGHLDVYDASRRAVLAESVVRAGFPAVLHVELPSHAVVEVRVYWYGRVRMTLGEVRLLPGG